MLPNRDEMGDKHSPGRDYFFHYAYLQGAPPRVSDFDTSRDEDYVDVIEPVMHAHDFAPFHEYFLDMDGSTFRKYFAI